MSFDIDLLRETMTVVSFVVFAGIIAFALHPRNRKRFDAAAQLPPDELGN
jgi:cytochrome c oxidase cbb3-type subunit 4